MRKELHMDKEITCITSKFTFRLNIKSELHLDRILK